MPPQRLTRISGERLREAGSLIGDQQDQGVLEHVVIERTQQLGHEERAEAASGEQPELTVLDLAGFGLAMFGHGSTGPDPRGFVEMSKCQAGSAAIRGSWYDYPSLGSRNIRLNDKAKLIGIYSDHPVQRWDGKAAAPARERVAEEVPVALVYNGLPHVVMMASPADLEDFALGFSLSEGVLRTPRELDGIEIVPLSEGVEVHMSIDVERYRLIENQRRNLPGRSGCGLCGTETIDQAVRHPAPVGAGPHVSHDALHRAFAALAENQRLNAATGAVHAAAWATPAGELQLVREDVGRHNALDKLIGAMISAGYEWRMALH